MKTIAALGPESTFSEIAARMYADQINEDASILLFRTIKRVFSAVGETCRVGVLPIENLVDGYVQPVLDLLLHSKLTIVDELLLPIHFSFVANCHSLDEVKRVYVQFVSQGQCTEFLDGLPDVELVTTQSNGDSLQRVRGGDACDGAVIPFHSLESHTFPFVVENINDYEYNQTRFIVVAEQESEYDSSRRHKTSIVILEGVDRPGMLSDILAAFSSRSINLVSIMSRPTKESMGKYHFFVDIDGYVRDSQIREALAEVRDCGYVKLLGSYPKAREITLPPSAPPPVKLPSLQDNPFLPDRKRPSVFIASGKGPYQNTRTALSRIDLSPVNGKRVLLKPNTGRIAESGSGVVTHCGVVSAAIDAFREAGATVAVGESPVTGVRMAEAYEASGIAALAREKDCLCIDMDKRKPIDVSVPDGVALDTIRVCADVFDFDFIVSIPVMKMHMHTGVSLSTKNMKGCLWSRSKVDLHMLPNIPFCDDKSLDVAIADMASVLRPHLVIIDGTVGMEGLGPSAGEPKPLDLTLVGADPFAADSVACRLMGTSAQQVPHLRIGAERSYGIISIDRIDIQPTDWQQLVSPFAPPPANLNLQFSNVTILDEQSCSACQSTVLMFMKRSGDVLFDSFPSDKPVSIVIGKGHKTVPPNSLCVGNCTRPFRELGVYVSGCPPVASSIIKAIHKQKDDGKAR